MAQFAAHPPAGEAVQQLEVLLRTALFKPANELLGWLLQEAADRVDAAYQPKPGQFRKGREPLQMQGIFGSFTLQRDYYYHPQKAEGHYPADAALGLEGAYTPRWRGSSAWKAPLKPATKKPPAICWKPAASPFPAAKSSAWCSGWERRPWSGKSGNRPRRCATRRSCMCSPMAPGCRPAAGKWRAGAASRATARPRPGRSI